MSDRKEQRTDISQGKRKAMIIGISHYNDLKSLDLCKNDAEELFKLLSEQGYDIPDDHKLIGYVPYDSMRTVIIKFFNNQGNRPKDTLLFYLDMVYPMVMESTIWLLPMQTAMHPLKKGSILYEVWIILISLLVVCSLAAITSQYNSLLAGSHSSIDLIYSSETFQ